jgi:hypothetical protein
MEPLEVLGFAGAGVAGLVLGRMSRSRQPGEPGPGDAIATAGARASRSAAFGAAKVGSRALVYSAAGVAVAGSLASRAVGIGADIAVGTGDAVGSAARRAFARRSPLEHRTVVPGAGTTPVVEETESGLVVPIDADTTV